MKIVLIYRNLIGDYDKLTIKVHIQNALSIGGLANIVYIDSINVLNNDSKKSIYGNLFNPKENMGSMFDSSIFSFGKSKDCFRTGVEHKLHETVKYGFNKGVKVEVSFSLHTHHLFSKKPSNQEIKKKIKYAISLDSSLELIKISGLKNQPSFYSEYQFDYDENIDDKKFKGFEEFQDDEEVKEEEKQQKKVAEIFRLEGNKYFKKNQFEKALEFYNKARVSDPINPKIYFNIGITLKKMGQIKDAIIFFKQSIKFNSNYLKPSWNLATIFVDKKNSKSLTHLLDNTSSKILPKLTKMIAKKWPKFSLEKYQLKEKSKSKEKPKVTLKLGK
ncbi:MAG: tetratricopeptide repeat protein [Gammaproteobacteria bacterium]|jgi:tetratricopeptide (TPR) repeat protein